MNRLIRVVMLLVSLAIPAATMALVPAAQADTGSSWCTGANQTIDPVSGNCVTNTVTEGALQASVNESLKGKAYLKLVTKGDVALNVHTQPIPKQQINRCWTVKPGTVIKNEVVDVHTGKKIIINWVVPANDNVFCTEKGQGNQVFKKSCGNRTWNVPGQPNQPKPPKSTTKGKFKVMDYVTWKALLKAYLSKHLTGSLSVESADHTCQASASFDNLIKVTVYELAKFRGRFMAQAHAQAVRSIGVKVKNDSSATGKLSTKISVKIKNKLSAMCNTTPPPPPTPAFSCNTLHVTLGDHKVTVDTFNTSQSGGATFKNAVINWGDGTSDTSASPVGLTHNYGADGTFSIKGTAHFDVNGTDQSATSSGCQQAVTFTTQVQPCGIDTVEQPNDVLWGNTRTIKVTGTCPTGVQATLKSSAIIGSIASADQSVAVSGSFTVLVHYTAPTEGTSDTYTAKLYSSTNHLDDQKSVTFGLTQPTPDPLVKAPSASQQSVTGGHVLVG
jgi:hypothetical protein